MPGLNFCYEWKADSQPGASRNQAVFRGEILYASALWSRVSLIHRQFVGSHYIMLHNRIVTINKLIETYRSAVLLLLPVMDKVGIGWRNYEQYDEWDRIEEALFQSIVSDALAHEYCGLPKICNVYDPKKHSLLFDEGLGERFAFRYFSHGEEPFDVANFVPIACEGHESGSDIKKLVIECRFAIHRREYRTGNDLGVTTEANIGSLGSSAPSRDS